MPDRVVAQVSLQSAEGSSVLDADEPITSDNIDDYRAGTNAIEGAKEALRGLGFDVVQASEVGLSILGDKDRFEEVFDTTLKARSESADAEPGDRQAYEAMEPVQVPDALAAFVDEITFPVPPEFH
ncbi:hypothetical protein [Salinibacter ruber]|uniref:Uncharacterized protein n=1 Tax=Salinibacter ruber TaxID=146919 RepID=A0AAW5P3U3_9BACT|nr:hypothetical protein [Salinibacter ruber]MCS3665395.1 hypothetical protein [Salinibacter ruber]MCS3862717.1 hypothetical protein [Salinibacter ruber]MCS4156109.1 hypothetical protein [Salinibacter ruber]MCS4223523.1 hypothetical protein [Salinibacter ruber]